MSVDGIEGIVLHDLLECVCASVFSRCEARRRPQPPVIAWAKERYTALLVVDGSTLDALLRKVGLRRGAERNPLAGEMTALHHLPHHPPPHAWHQPDPPAHRHSVLPHIP